MDQKPFPKLFAIIRRVIAGCRVFLGKAKELPSSKLDHFLYVILLSLESLLGGVNIVFSGGARVESLLCFLRIN